MYEYAPSRGCTELPSIKMNMAKLFVHAITASATSCRSPATFLPSMAEKTTSGEKVLTKQIILEMAPRRDSIVWRVS